MKCRAESQWCKLVLYHHPWGSCPLKELCQFVFSQECGHSFVCMMLQKVQNKDQEQGIIQNSNFQQITDKFNKQKQFEYQDQGEIHAYSQNEKHRNISKP